VHQPRFEPAPTRVHVPGDDDCEVFAVLEPAAWDVEANRLVGQAVDHSGGVLLLGAAEAGAKQTEAMALSLTASTAPAVRPRRRQWRRGVRTGSGRRAAGRGTRIREALVSDLEVYKLSMHHNLFTSP
jgi:hypothetical protein